MTIVNVQESDFLLLTSPEDLSPQSARVATLNIHKKILFNCPRWQKPNTILTMCKATDTNGVDMILWYLVTYLEFSYLIVQECWCPNPTADRCSACFHQPEDPGHTGPSVLPQNPPSGHRTLPVRLYHRLSSGFKGTRIHLYFCMLLGSVEVTDGCNIQLGRASLNPP